MQPTKQLPPAHAALVNLLLLVPAWRNSYEEFRIPARISYSVLREERPRRLGGASHSASDYVVRRERLLQPSHFHRSAYLLDQSSPGRCSPRMSQPHVVHQIWLGFLSFAKARSDETVVQQVGQELLRVPPLHRLDLWQFS